MLSKKNVFLVIFSISCFFSYGQELARKSLWGARFSYLDNQGLKVRSINSSGSFFNTNIKEGDTILKIGAISMNSPIAYRKALRKYKSGAAVSFEVKRDKKTQVVQLIPKPYPYERVEDLDILYHSLTSQNGDGIRVIETKSKNVQGKLPTIIFIPWLSCGTVEKPFNSKDGWIDMFYGLARAGFNVIRIEKPGVGDSTGPDCSDYGFDYELKVYENIISKLLDEPFINKEELILWGGSMGGSMAPIIVNHLKLKVKGIIVSGSYYKTWYEHMLEIERRMATLNGKSASQVNDYILKVADFYNLYLNKGLSPLQILETNPNKNLKEVWTEDTKLHQYGRPVKYYIEANKYNIPSYWDSIKTPTVVIHGEYDWVMSKEDHIMIFNHMKEKNQKTKLISVPKMDHNFNIYPSLEASYNDSSQEFNENALQDIVNWIRSVLE